MKQKLKKILLRCTKMMLASLMIISSMAASLSAVKAGNASLTWGNEVYYPSWLGNWSTRMCWIDGSLAYCLNASKDTPPAGQYSSKLVYDNESLLKVLYYGYGGPGNIFADETDTNEETLYLYTHILASYAYSGDVYGVKDLNELAEKGINLLGRWNDIMSREVPKSDFYFTNSSLKAYYDRNANEQRTENITFKTNSDVSVSMTLQSGVTLHNVTKGTTGTGTVSISGGDTFYLSAPLKAMSDYHSGNLTGKGLMMYAPLVIETNGGYQDEGTLNIVQDTRTISLDVEWIDTGYLEIYKKSSNPDMTDDNDCYSLKGAEYGIYSGNNLIETLVTDNKGYAKSGALPEGEYSIRELKASKGFMVDTESHKVTIASTKTVTLNVTEEPENDPSAIEIYKLDKETGEASAQGSASLAGAQFTIKYYDGYYTKDNLPKNATRTWVIKTIQQSSGRYRAALIKNCLVFGDDFYYMNGVPTLPLGTITIEETKAPEGYLLEGYTIKSVNSKETVTNGVYLTQIKSDDSDSGASVIAGNYYEGSDEVIMGKIRITKKDSKTGETVSYKQTVFGIYANENMYIGSTLYKKGQLIQSLKTVDGVSISKDLPYGNYLIREDDAPDGYVISVDSETVSLETDGKIYDVTVSNTPKSGSIEITKQFDSTVSGLTGDATVKGAEYTLYANADIADPATGKILFSKGDVISKKKTGTGTWGDTGIKTTDSDGIVAWSNLPLGKYYVQETDSSTGCLINDEKMTFTLSEVEPDQKETITKSKTAKEEIKEQQVEIFKEGIGEGNTSSGQVKGLNDVTFVIKLKSDVDRMGWDDAPVYDEVTTETNSEGEKGYATTKALPYGTYIMKETKTPDGYTPSPDIVFSIARDQIHTDNASSEKADEKHIAINNELAYAYVRLIKKDADTGKTVSLNSASFRIKDSEGNYVTQKVGFTKYSVFTTNSKNQVIPDEAYFNRYDAVGAVVTPLKLAYGTYTIEEIETPDGFLSLEKPVEFTFGDTINLDEDNDMTVEIEIHNRQPKATLEISKSVTDWDNIDTDLVDHSDLSEIKFNLIAKTEVQDDSDGSIIYEEGQIIDTYQLDTDGHLIIADLPVDRRGTTYVLQEVQTLDGLVLKEEKYVYTFNQEDMTTEVYEHTFEIENETTKIEISKTDVTGEKEIAGANMQVADADGNIIDEWISTDKAHHIQGLKVDETYTLTEIAAPDGYVRAFNMEFTVNKTGEVQTVNMKDKVVTVSKQDVAGKEIEGAVLQVIDKEGDIIDEWTSTKERHIVSGLEEGKTYILHEDTSPLGYVLSKDIEFTVTEEKEDQKVSMTDKIVTVSKQDVAGKEIEGAVLQVIDKEGNIIDEWTSTKEEHIVSGLEEGKTYILHEDTSPLGYVLSKDIEFTVTEEKENQKIDMTDTVVKVLKTDEYDNPLSGAKLQVIDTEGNIIDEWKTTSKVHKVSGLAAGKKYILREVDAPKGYATAKEQTFTVSKDKDISLVMVDEITKVVLHKQDITTKEELEGAKLTVTDKETGKVIDTWISGKTAHEIQGLEVEKTYIMTEVIAPANYKMAESVEFTVTDTGVEQQVYMYDELENSRVVTGDQVSILKYYISFFSIFSIFILGIICFFTKRNN